MGVTLYGNSKPKHVIHLYSPPTGLGCSFTNRIYALDIPYEFMNYSVVNLEILNLVIALKILDQCWKDQYI